MNLKINFFNKDQILSLEKTRQEYLNLRFTKKIEYFYESYNKFKNIKSFFLYFKFIYRKKLVDQLKKKTPIKLLSYYKDLDYYRLVYLQKFLKKKKPKLIVEFGAGLSTFILLDAINKLKIDCKIISYDNSIEYVKKTKEFLLEFDPKKKVEIRLCQLDYFIFNNSRYICYKDADYPKKIDFLYVDGPVVYNKEHNSNLVMCGDIIRLIQNNIFPKYFIFDKKFGLSYSVKHELKKIYKKKFNFLFKTIEYETK